MDSPNPSNSPPPTSSPSFDPAQCTEYISTKSFRSHQLSLSASPSTPLYTIKKHESLSRAKPSIVMHAGAEKTGPVVGVSKIHPPRGRHYTIGLGDPDSVPEEGGGDAVEQMVWEKLQRMEKWRFRWYEFEFGEGAERRFYTWRRTRDRWPRRLRDMELRVGREEGGELVAVWRGGEKARAKNGRMFVKRRGEGVGEEKWRLVVLLTALSIIEDYVRRSR